MYLIIEEYWEGQVVQRVLQDTENRAKICTSHLPTTINIADWFHEEYEAKEVFEWMQTVRHQ